MALSMHTNYTQLVTQNTLNKTSNLMNTAMERLSTGFRINSAADDAAGLQIANRLEAQTRGMSVAMRNAQDGISMMQTAEGAMDEMTNIVYRMKDLALQASNDTASSTDRAAMDAEYAQLGSELANIMESTNFGGQSLFKASGGAFTASAGVNLQIGTNSGEQLKVDIKATIDTLNSALVGTTGASGTAIAAPIGTLSNATGAKAALDLLTGADGNGGLLSDIGEARSSLGANINRLEHTITNLGNMSENTSAAKGRIMDADFAVESASMTKNQMLMQAGTSMLNQTKQMSGMAMSLLG